MLTPGARRSGFWVFFGDTAAVVRGSPYITGSIIPILWVLGCFYFEGNRMQQVLVVHHSSAKTKSVTSNRCGDHAILWLRDLGLPRLRAVDLGFWLWMGAPLCFHVSTRLRATGPGGSWYATFFVLKTLRLAAAVHAALVIRAASSLFLCTTHRLSSSSFLWFIFRIL